MASNPSQIELRGMCAHPRGGYVLFPWQDTESSVPERFEKVVREVPNALAIETEHESYTYAQLEARVNQIARSIRQELGGRGRPVALLFEHGAAPLVSLMAVLKAGHIYLPLDPDDPELRIRQLLEHSGAEMVLTSDRLISEVAMAARGVRRVLNVDDLPGSLSDSDLGLEMDADAGASLYYTSGSTGQPKGVLSSHRARLVNALRNINSLQVSPHDRCALLYPSRFAGAVNTTFGGLLAGASVLPFDYRRYGGGKLGDWLEGKRITIYHSVPAMFRQLVASADQDLRFADLRVIMLASDALYRSDLASYRSRFPETCLLANSWGVSESPFFRPFLFHHRSGDFSNGIPAVGGPFEKLGEEEELQLLDEKGIEVANGQPGELVLRSRFSATGYWQDPEQTAERFVREATSPEWVRYFSGDLGRRLPDGSIVHLGRKDFQVQIGGERVEVAEIEATLSQHQDVRVAVVAAKKTASGDLRLIAYIEPVNSAPAESELRDYLSQRLPSRMVPDRLVFCEKLPLTEGGKIDRRALPEPSRVRPLVSTPYVAPRTPFETAVAGMFEEALELDEVGVFDSFPELGGKSLGAMHILIRIRDRYGMTLEAADFFESPTVEATAKAVAACLANDADPKLVDQMLNEIEALSGEQAKSLLDEA